MNSVMKRIRIIAVLAAVALAGWLGWQQFGAPPLPPEGNLAGSSLGGDFALVDQDGRARTAADFAGQWRLMYFGYTFCPDVCPTDMAVIGQALRQFEAADGPRAAKLVPMFLTVDPGRDTPEAIKPFVEAFHPRFVGLTGDAAAVAAMMKAYGVYSRKVETRDGDDENYLVDHFAVYYLFGPDGAPVAFVPHGASVDEVRGMMETYVR